MSQQKNLQLNRIFIGWTGSILGCFTYCMPVLADPILVRRENTDTYGIVDFYVDSDTIYKNSFFVYWEEEIIERTSEGKVWHHSRRLLSCDCRDLTKSRLRRLRILVDRGRPDNYYENPWDEGILLRFSPHSAGGEMIQFVCNYRE